MRTLSLALVLVIAGCDDGGRTRDTPDDPDASVTPDAAAPGADGATPPPDDGGVAPDGSQPDAAADAAPPDPDAAPIPEVCDGDDDDGDGQIDEGVANICGGCGGLPPEGCQSWRVQLLRDEAGETDTNRVIGLSAGILAVSERRIEGADCEFIRVPAQHPDAHLGLVNVDAPAAMLNQVPTYDEQSGSHRYANSPDLGRIRLYGDGDPLTVRAGGGRLVGPFRETLDAPAGLAGVTGEDLTALSERVRGEGEGPATLRWTPAPEAAQAGELRLFIGGSVGLFNRNVYRAIRHYQLDGTLQDDGELTLPPEFFTPVPQSAVWVHLTRQRRLQKPFGPHGVEIVAGQRVEKRQSGALDLDTTAPFDILAPSPNERRVTPGEPLEIRWSAPPAGTGPLVVTLTLADNTNLEARQLSCTVDDPASGRLVLPGDATESWPMGQDDLRQLSVSYTIADTPLPAPDRGSLTQSVTLLLRLEP
jgi:hypothetical protein